MHILLATSLLLAPTLASISTAGTSHAPHSLRAASWSPAPNSTVTCNKTSDKYISFFVGPPMESVIDNACAAMMPPCAYPERVPDTVCAQTVDWALDGRKASVQSANVEDVETHFKLIGWDVHFSVAPTQQSSFDSATTTPVMWQRTDCYGYFALLLDQNEPGGCRNWMGSGIGKVVVGQSAALGETVFEITIVKSG